MPVTSGVWAADPVVPVVGPVSVPKTPTGIAGLDSVTGGGLPQGRPTLVCGPAGCGKTLLAMEFLVRGIVEFDEPGVFVAFEESTADLAVNMASLGFDLKRLEADGALVLDHIDVSRADLVETGEWDLDGLMLRIGASIDQVGAKRVVIDTIEALFGGFGNVAVLRAELVRLFAWLKDRGVTAVITAERGDGALTRYGIEEYVSDCVIVLDHRVSDQNSTRRLRILKYRGSLHGTNEYPFLITETGLSVLPLTALGLQHGASNDRVSTGVARLDAMLGGGLYVGSTVLVSGTSGTGKSTLGAQLCDERCRRGERAIYFALEESEAEIVRNMASVGIDLQPWIDEGLLRFHCYRPSLLGLEAHLFAMQRLVAEFNPTVVVTDPVSALARVGTVAEVTAMVIRQIDFFKARGITTLLTTLSREPATAADDLGLASLVDTWLLLQTTEGNGEHNRLLYVRKARGTAHSNQIREFLITPSGIELTDVYVGAHGVLTGSARQAQEAREQSDGASRHDALELRLVDLERRRAAVEAQTTELWREFEAEADVVDSLLNAATSGTHGREDQRAEQGRLRHADTDEAVPADSDDAGGGAT